MSSSSLGQSRAWENLSTQESSKSYVEQNIVRQFATQEISNNRELLENIPATKSLKLDLAYQADDIIKEIRTEINTKLGSKNPLKWLVNAGKSIKTTFNNFTKNWKEGTIGADIAHAFNRDAVTSSNVLSSLQNNQEYITASLKDDLEKLKETNGFEYEDIIEKLKSKIDGFQLRAINYVEEVNLAAENNEDNRSLTDVQLQYGKSEALKIRAEKGRNLLFGRVLNYGISLAVGLFVAGPLAIPLAGAIRGGVKVGFDEIGFDDGKLSVEKSTKQREAQLEKIQSFIKDWEKQYLQTESYENMKNCLNVLVTKEKGKLSQENYETISQSIAKILANEQGQITVTLKREVLTLQKLLFQLKSTGKIVDENSESLSLENKQLNDSIAFANDPDQNTSGGFKALAEQFDSQLNDEKRKELIKEVWNETGGSAGITNRVGRQMAIAGAMAGVGFLASDYIKEAWHLFSSDRVQIPVEIDGLQKGEAFLMSEHVEVPEGFSPVNNGDGFGEMQLVVKDTVSFNPVTISEDDILEQIGALANSVPDIADLADPGEIQKLPNGIVEIDGNAIGFNGIELDGESSRNFIPNKSSGELLSFDIDGDGDKEMYSVFGRVGIEPNVRLVTVPVDSDLDLADLTAYTNDPSFVPYSADAENVGKAWTPNVEKGMGGKALFESNPGDARDGTVKGALKFLSSDVKDVASGDATAVANAEFDALKTALGKEPTADMGSLNEKQMQKYLSYLQEKHPKLFQKYGRDYFAPHARLFNGQSWDDIASNPMNFSKPEGLTPKGEKGLWDRVLDITYGAGTGAVAGAAVGGITQGTINKAKGGKFGEGFARGASAGWKWGLIGGGIGGAAASWGMALGYTNPFAVGGVTGGAGGLVGGALVGEKKDNKQAQDKKENLGKPDTQEEAKEKEQAIKQMDQAIKQIKNFNTSQIKDQAGAQTALQQLQATLQNGINNESLKSVWDKYVGKGVTQDKTGLLNGLDKVTSPNDKKILNKYNELIQVYNTKIEEAQKKLNPDMTPPDTGESKSPFESLTDAELIKRFESSSKFYNDLFKKMVEFKDSDPKTHKWFKQKREQHLRNSIQDDLIGVFAELEKRVIPKP